MGKEEQIKSGPFWERESNLKDKLNEYKDFLERTCESYLRRYENTERHGFIERANKAQEDYMVVKKALDELHKCFPELGKPKTREELYQLLPE